MTRRTDPLPLPIPPPTFTPIGQGPSSVARGSQYRRQSPSDSAIKPCGGEVTKRTGPISMPILPPPIMTPMGQGPSSAAKESQCLSGDKNSYKNSSREWVPCLRCKEFSFDCQGLDIKLGGSCSYCHMDRKRCEWESCASDQNLNAPSSSSDPQSLAIKDEILHSTVSTSNDYRINIDVPNSQPDTTSSLLSTSSSQQYHQGTPIAAGSRDHESSNKIGGFADDYSIPGAPEIGHGGKDCPMGKRGAESATDGHEDDMP